MNTQHTVIVNFIIGWEQGKYVTHKLGQRRLFDDTPRWAEQIMFRTASGACVVGDVVRPPIHDIDGHVNVSVIVYDDADGKPLEKYGDPVELGIVGLVTLARL